MNEKIQNRTLLVRPSVKRYSSINKYIEDLFSYRKSLDPSFTLEIWSAELGFKSRSFVSMVYNGQRPITLNFLLALSQNLKLTESEQDHLYLIFDYSKIKKISQKKMYLSLILESLESNEKKIDLKNQAQFLSSQNLLLIKLLLAFDDIKGTEKELSKLLGVSLREVKRNLKSLEGMDLVIQIDTETREEKIWKSKDKAFIVARDITNESVNLFHQNTMEECKNVLFRKDLIQKFHSIFFALPEDSFSELTEEMERFLTKIKNKYGFNEFENKSLIKLNLQAYEVVKNRN